MKKIIIYLLFLPIFIYSKDLILTNNQVNYTISKNLTKNTKIKVEDVFNTESNMKSNQYNELSKVDLSKYKNVRAVITLDKVWDEDSLYEYMRRININVVNIDSTYSYRGNSSLAIAIKNYDENSNKINPYVWLNLYNLEKMYKIVALDLIEIFPNEKNKILNNLNNNLNKIDKIIEKYNDINIDSAILLTEDLQYLMGFLNIFYINIDYNEINEKNILNILENEQIDTIISSRPLKREIVKILKENNKKYVLLNTGAYPLEDDEDEDIMREDGLDIYIMENFMKLKEIQ